MFLSGLVRYIGLVRCVMGVNFTPDEVWVDAAGKQKVFGARGTTSRSTLVIHLKIYPMVEQAAQAKWLRCLAPKIKNLTNMKMVSNLLALLLVVLAFSAHAQLKVIPKVGVNFSGVDGNIADFRAEARVGWNAGLDFRLGEGRLFLYPGIQFNNYTARLIQDVSIDPDDLLLREETTIQALKAPLNLGLRLNRENGLINLFVRGGVTPTYVLGLREKNGIPFTKDDLNAFTWGANAGLGIDLLFLTIDANYEWGLNDYFSNTTGRNDVFTVSAGIRF